LDYFTRKPAHMKIFCFGLFYCLIISASGKASQPNAETFVQLPAFEQPRDSGINPEIVPLYAKVRRLITGDPALKSKLTPEQLKTLNEFDRRYQNNKEFREVIKTELRDKKEEHSQEEKDSPNDRRKASLDHLQKFLDLIRSMSVQF
jgi:hypothetical protein